MSSSSSSSNSNQPVPTWVPYVPVKDCSQGFCSIYCPQWCYFLFPPPPPLSSINNDSSSSPVFSPLVIAIMGILASAFLLITYYTIISKYCTPFRNGNDSRSHTQVTNRGSDNPIIFHVSNSDGLDDSFIHKIPVWKYNNRGFKAGDNLEITDCSVCLSEFREGEDLRLLPTCTHAFHLQCIDTWLKSHSNCPLCRANIEKVKDHETIVMINDHIEENTDTNIDVISDGGNEDEIIEVREEESTGRSLSIADVLQLSMEEELIIAKEKGIRVMNRRLHSVKSGPVQMKRSLSSGRLLRNGSVPIKRHLIRDSVIPNWDNSN